MSVLQYANCEGIGQCATRLLLGSYVHDSRMDCKGRTTENADGTVAVGAETCTEGDNRGCSLTPAMPSTTSNRTEANVGALLSSYYATAHNPCITGVDLALRCNHLQRALERLETLAFVGLTDRWAASVCLFHATFGGRMVDVEVRGFRHSERTEGLPVSESDRELQDADALDYQVFLSAQHLFVQRLRRYRVPLEVEGETGEVYLQRCNAALDALDVVRRTTTQVTQSAGDLQAAVVSVDSVQAPGAGVVVDPTRQCAPPSGESTVSAFAAQQAACGKAFNPEEALDDWRRKWRRGRRRSAGCARETTRRRTPDASPPDASSSRESSTSCAGVGHADG